MTRKAYNGWTNYETWNVALWIDNEQGSYHERQRMAQEAWDEAEADRTFTRLERATLNLSQSIRDWIEEQNPLGSDASTFSDLLSAALSEVNWHEIAENFLTDVEQAEEETEETEQ